jgi:hypothetical protein
MLASGRMMGAAEATGAPFHWNRGDRFGRMFPALPPFAAATPAIEAALLELGRIGGVMDARDDMTRTPLDLIVDPALNENNPNNPTHTAGTTFMGQFMDHDMTRDASSRLAVPSPPEQTENLRTPSFDLDSVYGGGPIVSPQLYDANWRFRVGETGEGGFEDLPRDASMTAIIGDSRNDENAVIAGLHAGFLLFHNRVMDDLGARGRRRAAIDFVEARMLTTWHYQWMILHEFLPQFVGQAVIDDVRRRGRRFYRPHGQAYIPVEFQTGAYRFGHSMVRPSYRLNMAGDGGAPFVAFIFSPDDTAADPDDLRGGRSMRRFVGWQTFFDFGTDPYTGKAEVKPNKRIDRKLSTPLFLLPTGTLPAPGGPISLAQRNLLRHLTWQLPSGQSVAREMGTPMLSSGDLDELRALGGGLESNTPLWYYTLAEAEVMEDGLRLGPVGGRIVAEVILGLLELDPASFVRIRPNWRPTLPAKFSGRGEFRMIDFLAYAGVDPASRGQ